MAPLVNLITVKLLSPRHDRNRIDGRHQFSQYATGVNRARVRISYIKWVGRDYALICADFHRFYGTKGRPVDPSLVIFTFHDAGGAVERCHISLVTGWKCKWRERGFRLKILPAKKKPNSAPDLWNSVWITIGFAFCWELRKSLDQLLAIPIFLLFLLPVFDFGVLFISSTENCKHLKIFLEGRFFKIQTLIW